MAAVDAGPGDEAGHCGDVEEPVEDGAAAARQVEEGEQAEGRRERHGRVRHAALGCALEEGWGEAGVCEADEDTRARVDVGVGGREDDEEEDGVDETWEHLDARELSGDDEGRGSSVGRVGEEVGVVVGHEEADEEDGEDEEEQDAVEGLADRCWDVLSRVLCLAGSNADQFGALVGEAGLDQDGPESDEFRQSIVVCDQVWRKRSRIAPGVESKISVLSSSGIDADAENQEPDDGKHLDGREPELKLAIKAHGQEIDGGDNDPEDRDEDSDGEVLVPVLDDETGGRELQGECDGPGKPVDPAHGEPQAGVNKTSSVVGESSRDGDVGRHLAEGRHDRVDNGADEDIRNECSSWS